MIVVLTVVVLVVMLLLRRRRHRKSQLAGLLVDKPTYSLTPPSRFSTRLKDHRL